MECAPVQLYNPEVFTALPPFESARELLPSALERIGALGDVICKHQMNGHVGVCLLHKHFEMQRHEILGRRRFHEAIVATPVVCPPHSAKAYMWKAVVDEKIGRGWYPLEFVVPDDPAEASADGVRLTFEFLRDMTATLVAANLTEIFGVSILNSRFLHSSVETGFLETSDEHARVLNLNRVQTTRLREPNITQTQWSFRPEAGDTACSNHGGCSGHCGHCSHTGCDGHCFHS